MKKPLLIEVTICFETSLNHAAERKELKYEDLVVRARSAGYRVVLSPCKLVHKGSPTTLGSHT